MMPAFLAAALACQALTAAPLVGAHRGLSAGEAENTLHAFHRAADLGATIIELDLRTTADGALVVMHDPTVNRTTDGKGAVGALTLAQLRQLDAGRWAGLQASNQPIPELNDVLRFARERQVTLLLDIKESGIDFAQVVRQAREAGASDRIVLGVRSQAALRKARAAAPDVRILAFAANREAVHAYVASGADIVRLWSDWLVTAPELARKLQDDGRQVWGLVGPRRPADDAGWRKAHSAMICAGVDAIITDRPELLAPANTP